MDIPVPWAQDPPLMFAGEPNDQTDRKTWTAICFFRRMVSAKIVEALVFRLHGLNMFGRAKLD